MKQLQWEFFWVFLARMMRRIIIEISRCLPYSASKTVNDYLEFFQDFLSLMLNLMFSLLIVIFCGNHNFWTTYLQSFFDYHVVFKHGTTLEGLKAYLDIKQLSPNQTSRSISALALELWKLDNQTYSIKVKFSCLLLILLIAFVCFFFRNDREGNVIVSRKYFNKKKTSSFFWSRFTLM